MADGGKANRDLIKQLRSELDEARKKSDDLERQIDNSKVRLTLNICSSWYFKRFLNFFDSFKLLYCDA